MELSGQELHSLIPVISLYLPSGHISHPGSDSLDLNIPSPQLWHWLLITCVPTGHNKHSVLLLFLVYSLVSHISQLILDISFL